MTLVPNFLALITVTTALSLSGCGVFLMPLADRNNSRVPYLSDMGNADRIPTGYPFVPIDDDRNSKSRLNTHRNL